MAHFGPCSQDTHLKSVGHKILLKGNISRTTPFDYLLVFNLTTTLGSCKRAWPIIISPGG
jgi:hypothetical protein